MRTQSTLSAIVTEVFEPWAAKELSGRTHLELRQDPGKPWRYLLVLWNHSGLQHPAHAHVVTRDLLHERVRRLEVQGGPRAVAELLELLVSELVNTMYFRLVYERGGYC
jgi:hypothetical protein